MPKVSFIIPAYNAEATLKSCIQSILLQNDSTFEKEIIVINNNSTDSTPLVAKSFDCVNVVFKKERSRSLARQEGLQIATGEYVAFVDADVLLTPTWTSELLKLMIEKPQLGGVQGKIEPLIEKAWHFIRWHRSRAKSYGTFNHLGLTSSQMIPVINTAASLWRKQSLRGGFNSTLNRAEDIDLTMKVLSSGYSLAASLDALAFVKWDQSFMSWVLRFYEQARYERFVYESWGLIIQHGKLQNIFNHQLWSSLPLYTQFTELLVSFIHLIGWKSHLIKADPSEKFLKDQSPIFKTFKHDRFYLGNNLRSIFVGNYVAVYSVKTFKCIWIDYDEYKWGEKLTHYLLQNKIIIKKIN